MIVQCGMTDTAPPLWRDAVYLDNLSGQRVILEVLVVTMGSDSSLAAGARSGPEGSPSELQALEREKRNHGVIQKVLSDPEITSEAMGPSMVDYFKNVYERAQVGG